MKILKNSFQLGTIVFVLLLFSCVIPTNRTKENGPNSKTSNLIMAEKLLPLTSLETKVFPDDGFIHRNGSTSVFMWPVDLPVVDHKANSIMARMTLLQYQAGGGIDVRSYSQVREQAFYVLEGEARFLLGESIKKVSSGDLIFVPSEVKHSYEVIGNVPLKMILMEWRNDSGSNARLLQGTLVSERLKPLRRLTSEEAGGHQGISASLFVTPRDYPVLKANSSMAWIALQQYDADPNLKATSVHTHDNQEQVFYIVEGKARFQLGEVEQDVGPGELVFAPRHVKHGYKVLGPSPVKWLMIAWSGE